MTVNALASSFFYVVQSRFLVVPGPIRGCEFMKKVMHTHRSTLVTSPTTREKGRVEIRSIVGSYFCHFVWEEGAEGSVS
jgi:hypothetical protein